MTHTSGGCSPLENELINTTVKNDTHTQVPDTVNLKMESSTPPPQRQTSGGYSLLENGLFKYHSKNDTHKQGLFMCVIPYCDVEESIFKWTVSST